MCVFVSVFSIFVPHHFIQVRLNEIRSNDRSFSHEYHAASHLVFSLTKFAKQSFLLDFFFFFDIETKRT